MTTATVTETIRNGNPVGRREELARYQLSDGTERVLIGQRVDGIVRVSDLAASGAGRAYLVERELERDGYAALQAMIADYLTQARLHDVIPMVIPVGRYLEHPA
jgi:hypothetical protein